MSVAALTSDLYSDSALLLLTIGCFFELHVMRFDPKYMQCPRVERRSSGELAQSASANPEKQKKMSKEKTLEISCECLGGIK